MLAGPDAGTGWVVHVGLQGGFCSWLNKDGGGPRGRAGTHARTLARTHARTHAHTRTHAQTGDVHANVAPALSDLPLKKSRVAPREPFLLRRSGDGRRAWHYDF